MPLNTNTPTNSLKVEKICNIGQRKYLFACHLSIDLTTFSLRCVRVIWWQLVICSFLGKLSLEKASVGLCGAMSRWSSPKQPCSWKESGAQVDTNEFW